MKDNLSEETIADAAHYLKSSLAGLQTIQETISLLRKEKSKQGLLLEKRQEEKLDELDFRIELFINFLLLPYKIKRLDLEFFEVEESLLQRFPKMKVPLQKEKLEIMTDKKLFEGLLVYLGKFVSIITSGKPLVSLTEDQKSITVSFSTKGPLQTPRERTDLNLELEMLKAVLERWSNELKGVFKVSKGVYLLKIPKKFTP